MLPDFVEGDGASVRVQEPGEAFGPHRQVLNLDGLGTGETVGAGSMADGDSDDY
jgi:hypothetical protein